MTGSLFLWGLLALLQIAFLPGYILVRALRLRTGVIDRLLLTFGLSTLCNYLFLTVLVYLHWYTWTVMIATILIETMVVVFLWTRDTSRQRWIRSAEAYQDSFAAWRTLRSPERAVVVAAAIFAVYCLFSIVHGATVAWQDSAFTLWDNIFSWNRWATDWYSNRPPQNTYRYPQLLPGNSSIVYVLSGTNTVQAFNLIFYALFPVGLFLCLIDLGLRRKQIGFWISIPLIYFAWTFMPRPGPTEGYADVPGTFMILMTIYCAWISNEQRDARLATRWILVSGLFAGAALVTKQVGLYIIIPLPALLALTVKSPALNSRQKRNAILWAFVLAIAVSVPWYIMKEIQIHLGYDKSEIYGAAIAHGGRGFFGRILNGLHQMFDAWGPIQTVAVAILAVVSIRIPSPWRWVTSLIVLPGVFIWSITTSYDLRNSNFCDVLGCVSAGVTIGWLLERAAVISRDWSVVARRAAVVASCVAFAFALSFMPTVANNVLTDRNVTSQKTAAMPALNAALFRLINEGKITRPVVTNYFVMPFIPTLKRFMAYDSLMDPAHFKETMEKARPEYIAIIHPSQNYPAVSDTTISANVLRGKWSTAETGPSFLLIKVHDNPLPSNERASRFGIFNLLDGLSGEEGPYPQWNMPTVRWGLGPATKLEFNVFDDVPYVLNLEVARVAGDLSIDVVLNGTSVATAKLTASSFKQSSSLKQFTYDIKPHLGKNQLELRYSAWDANSEARPLAVLFSTLQIVPK